MPAREHLVSCDPDIFAQTFNRLPHEVSHALADHPLFRIPALAKLAQKVATRENPHYSQGDIHVELQETDSNKRTDPASWADGRLAKLVQDIEQGKRWIILKHIQREPEYQLIFENCISDILDLSHGEIIKNIRWFEAVVFITSPNRVTNYHIDRECSWLLQIQGNKEIHLFNRADQDVLPDEELERYWIANHSFSAVYRPEYESRAMVHQLRPGLGVHIPVNTPHWLQNGNNVSVSVGINFQFQDSAWENLYKANYYLRRAGLTPASPGKNAFADRLKRGAYSTVQIIQRRLMGLPRVPTSEARKYYHRIVELRTSREI